MQGGLAQEPGEKIPEPGVVRQRCQLKVHAVHGFDQARVVASLQAVTLALYLAAEVFEFGLFQAGREQPEDLRLE